MADIDTPDSIGALPRSRTELIPGAKSVTAYQGATKQEYPEPPQDNSYSQLGAALAHFAGTTGVQAAHIAIEKQHEADTSEGTLAAQQAAMNSSIKNVNDAVKAGHLREGASPTAMLAFKTNFLKLRGEQGAMSARAEYYNNPDLRNSDDPNAFNKWSSDYMNKYLHSAVNGEDGQPQYSSLELSKSNIHGIMTNAMRGVQSEHIAHRVSEREKMFAENASTLSTTGLEAKLGTGVNLVPHEFRDYDALAQAVTDPYYNPTAGQVALGGMDRSKASIAMQDTIIDKAVAEKDANLLSIAFHIKTPGGSMGDSLEFKKKATAAIEHIASSKYVEEKRSLEIGLQRAHGPIDEQIATERENYQRTQNGTIKKNYVDSLEAKIYGYDPQAMSPKMAQERAETMAELKAADPKRAVEIDMALHKIDEAKFDYAHRRSFSLEEARLQNIVAKSPGTPATHATLLQALKDEKIDGPGYRRLRTESDQQGNDERDPRIKKLLSSRDYSMLEENVGKGVAKDLSKISGQESIAAGLAMHDFRSDARAFLKKNPNADAADLAAYMAPKLEPAALKYNEVARQEFESAEKTKKAQEQFIEEISKMQEKAQKEVEELRKMPPAENSAPITAQSAEKPPKDFNTVLSPKNEETFKAWKEKFAPKDSGMDYDLRGAFKAGLKPDAKTGHWPDTFKKPNHPTFSDQSKYAKFGKPGRWEGETFIPAP